MKTAQLRWQIDAGQTSESTHMRELIYVEKGAQRWSNHFAGNQVVWL